VRSVCGGRLGPQSTGGATQIEDALDGLIEGAVRLNHVIMERRLGTVEGDANHHVCVVDGRPRGCKVRIDKAPTI
jgi:hypothetical protein